VDFEQILVLAKKESATVKGAPVFFVIIVCMSISFGYGVAIHVEKGHEESLSDLLSLEKSGRANDKSMLEQRITNKDDLLTDYRSKLLIADLKGQPFPQPAIHVTETQRQLSRAATRFSNASNAQLRTMGVQLANNIRVVAHKAMAVEGGDQFRMAINDALFEYQTKYQADAVVLKDEMLTRLSGTLLGRAPYIDTEYSVANNPLVLNEVASDLETLAKKLPN
jgi:hypothetical protein